MFGKTRVHCSVPSQDVLCFTTNNNTDIDSYTKHLVCEQIKEKILSQQSTRINMRVTPTKSCGDKSVVNQNGKVGNVFKVERKKFKNKHMTIADINFEALQTPICCSTPTPSISGSTIVAGHFNVSIIDDIGDELPNYDDIEENDNGKTDCDEILDEYLSKMNKKSTPWLGENVMAGHKENYCSDWITKNSGVSTNNTDAPPLLYEPSVVLSDSLLNVTSVSRNASPEKVQKGTKNSTPTGRGIIDSKKYENTVFM